MSVGDADSVVVIFSKEEYELVNTLLKTAIYTHAAYMNLESGKKSIKAFSAVLDEIKREII